MVNTRLVVLAGSCCSDAACKERLLLGSFNPCVTFDHLARNLLIDCQT